MATESDLRTFGRLICAIADGKTMTREQACDAYRQVIQNRQPELQQGAFLMAHIARGPTTEELAGAWDALDRYDTAKMATEGTRRSCDIVGTGSDQLKTVNCSSPASLIAAGCGLPIAKKGARLVTGVSGASDIFEAWGVDLGAPLERAEISLREAGICYLPGEAFLKSGWARLIQNMRFTSAFNIIGPLTMPCGATDTIVIGAYAPGVCKQLISILLEIGFRGALAPYGMVEGLGPDEGMDEFSPCGPTRVAELRDGELTTYTVTPADFGIKQVAFDTIASREDCASNAAAVLDVLRGKDHGSLADFFCMNAAAALYCAGHAESYRDGMQAATSALAEGRALAKLKDLLRFQGRTDVTPVTDQV
ncbi:MAG: anthranilate phosphoribosyltransferase [Lentisphaerae bacterium]|jgi:anthranilate phosphoribosyltransferase|nr:anthranilate phosphoribosyltransferase [Lentisphaerota bacterium]MBT5609709.1 anthranilate phosphoribosyltransferase [Lentisphaerota bacterium]MBT7061445.1 anthranilate phosphoribosyltransferase [Lentisphaerota bacterium]MBT7844193.1 anthranilate phosphoribosyltransferase [Lentisphaerota bacterium]